MKISVATAGQEARSPVPGELKDAKYLFIVETDRNEVLKVLSCDADQADLLCAKSTVDENCEAIICGQIKKEAFDILYREGISRYDGAGKNVTEALKMLARYELAMITDCIGGSGCVGQKSGGECHEH